MRGHTLLELLIALSVGLLVMLSTLSLYRTQRHAFEQLVDRAQLIDAGLTALHLISTHLRLAGFASPLSGKHVTALFGCTSGRPVGAAGMNLCKADNHYPRSDGIEIRYLADTISTWPNRNGEPTDCLGQAITTTPANHANSDQASALSINRFFTRLSPSTGEPELYCEGSGRLEIAQPVVEGVERLQVRYRPSGTMEFIDARAVPPDQWEHIDMVKICVIVRGARVGRAVPYIDCNDSYITPVDTRRRKAFTRWVTLRNVSVT